MSRGFGLLGRGGRGSRRVLKTGERDGILRRAVGAVLDGRPGDAAEGIAQLVQADSRDVELYLLLGRLHRHEGDNGRAIRIHQNLLLRRDLDGDQRTRALCELAEDFQAGGYLERALASCEEARERAPRDPRVLGTLLALHESLGRYEDALGVHKRLARVARQGRDERDRAESRLLLGLAKAEHAAGRHDAARRAAKKAIQRDKRNVDAHLLLGELEAERGRNKAALAAWKAVPEIDGAAGRRVYPRLASAYASLDRARDFETLLRGRLERDETDVDARLALSRALAERGAVDEALVELQRVLDREPANLAARVARGRLLLGENRGPDAAKELSELLVVLDPGAAQERES